jgi:hypothetical protein
MGKLNRAVLVACLLASAPALRAEDAAEEPYAEDLGAEKKKAPTAELPGLKAPPAAEPKAPPCLVSGPAAEGKGCAGAYKAVSEGFLGGYKAMEAWVAESSAQVAASAEKVEAIEKSIRDNESQVTGLKLQRSKEAKAKLKELDKANKGLWRELDAARREQDSLCKGLSRAAAAKVKELTLDVSKRLSEAQKAQ